MSIFDRKPALRWVTPLAFVAVVGGTTGIVATATADNKLPDLTAQELLVRVQQADVDTFSGTVVQNSNLGIPDIAGLGGSDGASLSSLTSGSHTLGVWFAGPDKARLQVQGTNDESDVILNGKNLWNWSYKDNVATHRTLTAPTDRSGAMGRTHELPSDAPKTPQDAAKQALAAVQPTTEVSTAGTATVAGVDAYELVLTPKDEDSLITQVRIAVDGKRFVPLRVQVIAGQPRPAFEVAYSNISFDRPDDSQFTFKAPPGAEVKEVAPDTTRAKDKAARDKGLTKKQLEQRHADDASRPDNVKVVGKGWSSVLVSKSPTTSGAASKSEAANDQLASVLGSLPKASGTWGSGHVLAGTAFSAVVTDDGRIAVGSVRPELLYAALAK